MTQDYYFQDAMPAEITMTCGKRIFLKRGIFSKLNPDPPVDIRKGICAPIKKGETKLF